MKRAANGGVVRSVIVEMLFNTCHHHAGDDRGHLRAEGCERWPVLEIDDVEAAVVADDGIAAEDCHVENLGGAGAYRAETVDVESRMCGTGSSVVAAAVSR